jgi:uncharacterized membrane protein YqjE
MAESVGRSICNPFLVGGEMLAHSLPFVEASISFLECSIFSLLDNAAEDDEEDEEDTDFGDNGRLRLLRLGLKLNAEFNRVGGVRITSLLVLLISTQFMALVSLVVLFLLVTFRLLSLVVLLCVLVVFLKQSCLWSLDLISVLVAVAAAIFLILGEE